MSVRAYLPILLVASSGLVFAQTVDVTSETVVLPDGTIKNRVDVDVEEDSQDQRLDTTEQFKKKIEYSKRFNETEKPRLNLDFTYSLDDFQKHQEKLNKESSETPQSTEEKENE